MTYANKDRLIQLALKTSIEEEDLIETYLSLDLLEEMIRYGDDRDMFHAELLRLRRTLFAYEGV